MTQDLSTLSLSLGKYVLATALLVVFYHLLFREKASYRQCRVYLLSVAVLGLLLSQFHIEIFKPEARIVQIDAPIAAPVAETQPTIKTAAAHSPSGNNVLPVQPESSLWDKMAENITFGHIAWSVYGMVTGILFLLLIIQLFKIQRIKRKGRISLQDGFELVESDEIPTPFSFYKTIFLSPNLSGSKLEMILNHEKWHIRHRHYLDVFLMEMLVRLLWFNPVLWWVRRELRNVSEFDADRSVLDEGHDLYSYQTLILEEVMESNPYLANGFNNSFTKKRFIIMKNKNHIRYATLRRALILPFFLGVFSLLCFSKGKEEIRYIVKDTVKHNSVTTQAQQAGICSLQKDSDSDMANKLSNTFRLANKELNKLAKQKNDLKTMRKGMCKVLSILEIKVQNNPITESSLSDEFISIISKDDLTTLSANLKERIKCIDKLKKEKSSKLKAEGLQMQVLILKTNSLFEAVLSEAMRNHINRPTTEIADFKMIVQMTSEGIKLIGINGCDFKEIKINPVISQEVFVDKHGFSNRNSKASGFLFSMKKTSKGLSFEGIRGTAWLKLSFGYSNGICYQPIDQNGMCSLRNELGKKSEIKNEKRVESIETKTERNSDKNSDKNSSFSFTFRDDNSGNRKAAIFDMTDQNALKNIALYDQDIESRALAVGKLTVQSSLQYVAYYDKVPEIRKQATSKLRNKKALEFVAKYDSVAEVRQCAQRILRQLNEPTNN